VDYFIGASQEIFDKRRARRDALIDFLACNDASLRIGSILVVCSCKWIYDISLLV
jgi:hypothetical protein